MSLRRLRKRLGFDKIPTQGWRFATPDEKLPGQNVTPDPLHESFTHLRHVYFDIEPQYEGRFTVPTLYDKKLKTIVSNESSEIIRMFYHAFDGILEDKYKQVELFPKDLQPKIEEINQWTYNDINNGVYRSGFATYGFQSHSLESLFHRHQLGVANNQHSGPKSLTKRP